MRIALATWSARRVAGVEDYLSLLVPALRSEGHDVALWHEVDEPTERLPIVTESGIECFNAAALGVDGSVRALASWRPDVLYVHGIRDVGAERMLLDVAPAVFFVHTYTGTCISGTKTCTRPALQPCDRRFGASCLVKFLPLGCGGKSPATMWRLYQRESQRLKLLGRYRRIVTHSQHMRREMTKHGLAADVIPFPVPPQRIAAAQQQERWHLLFAGRMHYLKGGLLFLDALSHLTKLDRPLRVTFAGDGPDRLAWETRARQVTARANGAIAIDFTGWLAPEEITRLMSGVNLLVVPSVWPEPLGSVGPAAAQCGVPAAAFDVGGISEWLVDGVSGHLAAGNPPTSTGLAAAMTACLTDPAHYADLRRGAVGSAERFTMQRHMPALISALEYAVR